MRVVLEDKIDRHGPPPSHRAGQWDIRQVKIALGRLGFYEPAAEAGITADRDEDFRDALYAFRAHYGVPLADRLEPGSVTERVLNDELARIEGEGFYIWRTVGDDKVRGAHAGRAGQVFDWRHPPDGGHPGEDYNCRCWAELLNPPYSPWIAWASQRREERRAAKRIHPLLHEANAAAAVLWNGARISVAACWANSACRAWMLREGAQIVLENTYHLPPKTLPAFPDAKEIKPKGDRARWKDPKGKIYEWDYKKGEVEVYGKNKEHRGGFDPETGKKRSKAVKGRRYKE